jgi:hypothetical protein
MDNLFKLSDIGTKAGGVLAGSGGWSKGSGTGAKEGIGSMLAQGVGAAIGASDRRLKENVVPLGEGLYEFTYRQDTPFDLPEGKFIGYMADEIPVEALGPEIKGYKTVKAPYLPKRI